MTALHVKPFRGKVPRTDSRLIGPNHAFEAVNCKITSGRLDPIKGLALVHTSVAASIATMYRYKNLSLDYWLTWTTPVDVVRSPTAQDAFNRLFYTGDGEPRMTTFTDAISGAGPYPTAFYTLGVYIPAVAATLAVVGGVAPVETRSYVYTFRTQYAEESGPSLPVIVSGNVNGSWNLSAMELAPPNNGTVTGAVTLSPGVVEVTLNTARGLSVFEQVTFAGAAGMTSLNAMFPLLSVNLTTNKVTVALTTAQTYTSGGTWARRAPHNTTGMTRVIYRTVGLNTDYKRVAEIPATQATYNDTIAATALGETLQLVAEPPPKNMHSLGVLANGALFGLAGNQVCLSEQYKPYSWPVDNRYTFAGAGIAAFAAGNSVIVLTDGNPVVVTATVPEAASVARLPTYAPCVSKAGAVDVGGGCLYPSHDGLYLATPSDAKNMTDGLYRFDEWQAIVPTSFKAAFFDQRYYASHGQSNGDAARILVLDLAEPDSVTEVDERVAVLYANPIDGRLYAAQENKVFQWDADDANRYRIFWRGRDNQLGTPVNFSCAQVHANYGEIAPIDSTILNANLALLSSADRIMGALGSTEFGVYPMGASNLLDVQASTARTVQFALYKDGAIVFSKDLVSSEPFRLPGSFKSDLYSMSLTASIQIYSASMAQGVRELQQVAG